VSSPNPYKFRGSTCGYTLGIRHETTPRMGSLPAIRKVIWTVVEWTFGNGEPHPKDLHPGKLTWNPKKGLF